MTRPGRQVLQPRTPSSGAWLFLAAYVCSGLAALVYQVVWTRLLTLHVGHTTAAAATVVAAFMGGLALGSAAGGPAAAHATRRQALQAYAALEGLVIGAALVIPALLAALTPLLRWAYADGAPGLVFPLVRLASALAILLVPAAALGAAFPFAVRWFVAEGRAAGPRAGALYAANTAGAAVGALAAGFVLIPWIGVTGTTRVGVAFSLLAIGVALLADRSYVASGAYVASGFSRTSAASASGPIRPAEAGRHVPPWLVPFVVALTGFVTMTSEIAWTRVFSMILGPSTYAFAATLAVFVAGLAVGGGAGALLAARVRRPAVALAFALAATALCVAAGSSIAGTTLPRLVAEASLASGRALPVIAQVWWVAVVAGPMAIGLGVAFPLSLDLAAAGAPDAAPRRLGAIYAVNTLAGVFGALVAAFLLIPAAGLAPALAATAVMLAIGAASVVTFTAVTPAGRVACLLPAAAAIAALVWGPGWDRALLASGVYKYPAHLPDGVGLEPLLAAGETLYYREGAAGTVSVKRSAGALSLSIDGKVDASSSSDMVTQKLLAHLPLLLHDNPEDVAIVGLGSGVTLASALRHPTVRVDVIELSPEVVAASRYFDEWTGGPLDDPRTRLIVGDGRSHLSFSSRQYDVIVSEPSNPWMAGVAALFTREFFASVRERLAPGGLFCQWAHTYDIRDADLRSIVRTFASVYPHGTMWLVGEGDLLLIGPRERGGLRLDTLAAAWERPGVAADLAEISAFEPFAVLSLYAGGPEEMARFADDAPVQTDDRMAFEFTGPRALGRPAEDTVSAIRALHHGRPRAPEVARALDAAGAAEWRNRAGMMWRAGASQTAFRDYATAVRLDPSDPAGLDGLVRAAVAAGCVDQAVALVEHAATGPAAGARPWVALSRLFAATGRFHAARRAATEAVAAAPSAFEPVEQLASVFSDAGDADRLAEVASAMQQLDPTRAASQYYAAAALFLRGDAAAAIPFAERAIALDAAHAKAHNLLGAAHASRGNLDAARTAFRRALDLDPRDGSAYANLGALELSTGRTAEARALFAEALVVDPASDVARLGLTQVIR